MLQQARRMLAPYPKCSCGQQPLRVSVLGKNTTYIECPRCELRTARFTNPETADAAWCDLIGAKQDEEEEETLH